MRPVTFARFFELIMENLLFITLKGAIHITQEGDYPAYDLRLDRQRYLDPIPNLAQKWLFEIYETPINKELTKRLGFIVVATDQLNFPQYVSVIDSNRSDGPILYNGETSIPMDVLVDDPHILESLSLDFKNLMIYLARKYAV